jgi:hypothetical protein
MDLSSQWKEDVVLHETPMATLRAYPWVISQGTAASQEQIMEWNFTLDTKSCLGRVARAIAIVERHFPHTHVGYGEVWSDYLAGRLLVQVHCKPEQAKALRCGMLEEVLMYEDPHAVALIDGEQFDPLSTVAQMGEIRHPRIEPFPAWEGVRSARLVSIANQEKDAEKRLKLLDDAERLCPGTVLVAENRVGPLLLLGRAAEATALLKTCLSRRPTARTLFVLWLCTEKQEYLEQLEQVYTPQMTELLRQEGGLP